VQRYLPLTMLTLGLYAFILSLTGFKDAWSLAFATESSGALVQAVLDASLATPLASLFSGIVITSLVQSSSATIALIVATVSAGVISLEASVFMLMGANIGTTITNTIVGLALAHKPAEFERMVPAILVDDLFKVLNVALFFALELATGLLHGLSVAIVESIERLRGASGLLQGFPDFLDLITAPVVDYLIGWVVLLPVGSGWQALLTGVGFFALLIAALSLMGEALELFLHDRSRRWLDRMFAGRLSAFGVGFLICWLLQSSSVAVSLTLPLVSQAAMTLPTVYYYSIGAALATTCDAGQLLSYLKFGPIGLKTGLVHILLNLFGALIFLFVPGLNRLPVTLSAHLSRQMCRYAHAPALLLLYVGGLFFGVPLGFIFLMDAVFS